mmetsp:Transcript_98280/g.225614  ORF Transcript_98280/g.225614 Transcript_98280/m.225614 type:complete len:94 (+) Transcript_98280:487-768(+)
MEREDFGDGQGNGAPDSFGEDAIDKIPPEFEQTCLARRSGDHEGEDGKSATVHDRQEAEWGSGGAGDIASSEVPAWWCCSVGWRIDLDFFQLG